MALQYKKEHVESIDSTQKELVRRFQALRLQHGDVLSANLQTNSVGRYERKWVTCAGNLSLSMALNIPSNKAEKVPQLCFAAAVAMGEAIAALMPEAPLQYKWVNDLMIDGKKLGGILCQYYAPFVIIGVGVNMKSHPTLESYQATSLAEYGRVDVANLQDLFLRNFSDRYDEWLDGFEPIRVAWMKRGPAFGSVVKIRAGNEVHEGQFEGIDVAGNIMLLQNEMVRVLSYGETVPF